MSLVTIEVSKPFETYTVFKAGTDLFVHLAGPSESGGTGPCLCGFDRHARDEKGYHYIGFSVGGGVTGPGYRHHPCPECTALIDGRDIYGTHRELFTTGGAA